MKHERQLERQSSSWAPSMSWHSQGDTQHRDLNGSDGFGRPARGPPMSAEKRKDLQEQFDVQERNRKLWPLSYYIVEVPPVADREAISAAILLSLIHI